MVLSQDFWTLRCQILGFLSFGLEFLRCLKLFQASCRRFDDFGVLGLLKSWNIFNLDQDSLRFCWILQLLPRLLKDCLENGGGYSHKHWKNLEELQSSSVRFDVEFRMAMNFTNLILTRMKRRQRRSTSFNHAMAPICKTSVICIDDKAKLSIKIGIE